MSARVKWTGLNELIQQLTDAPANIRAEGLAIVREETEGTAAEVLAAYPRGATGNLAARVTTDYPSSDLLVGIVLSKSPHAHLYEFGTAQRKTASGANRGAMPKAGIMVPIAQRRRAQMFQRLLDLVERHGFRVTT